MNDILPSCSENLQGSEDQAIRTRPKRNSANSWNYKLVSEFSFGTVYDTYRMSSASKNKELQDNGGLEIDDGGSGIV